MQNVQLYFWPLLAHVLAYSWAGRSALADVRAMEAYSDGKSPEFLNWDRSLTVIKLVRDASLPRDWYPTRLKRKVILARVLFRTFPLVFVACMFLLVVLEIRNFP